MVRVFTIDELKSVISIKDAVETAERVFRGLGDGTVINPTKVTLDLGEKAKYPPYDGFFNAMPAYIGFQDVAGIKWVGGMLGERRKAGLPFISGMILLANPHLGTFKAVMDGAFITSLRTGAQTAISLKYIFKNRKSLNIGLYGCGQQGRTQIEAIAQVFDIDKLYVYDVRKPAAEKYKKDMANVIKGEIIICDDAKGPVANADAVITVTQARDGFLKADWVKPGTALFAMGSYKEIEDEVVLRSDLIIVDHIGQALHRGALASLVEQGKISAKNIAATIGDLVVGSYSVGDISKKRVLCLPIGTGAMDVALAEVAYERMVAKNMGKDINITGE